MRGLRRIVLLVPLALGCGGAAGPRGLGASQLAEAPRDDTEAALRLPAAAMACRDAGYPADEVARALAYAREWELPAAVMAEALEATAAHARTYGPVGDLGGWLGNVLVRQGLRGPVLERTIQVHHATWGARRVHVPAQEPTSARPPDPVEGA